MKRTLLLLMSVLLYAASAWAYSTTTVSGAQDSKGNALKSGAFYRILLPSRGANVALRTDANVYVQAYNGLGILRYMWKIEEDANGKALISTPAGGYWKFTEYAEGRSKLQSSGTVDDCTHFQLAWYSSTSKTLNMFDNSVEGSGYSYDNVYCGYVLSNHGGTGNYMGIYNNIGDAGSIFKFERFYQTLFVVEATDVNGVAVENYPATVTINGNITTSEYYTNSDNQITSFSTAYAAAYYIDGVEKTAEEVKKAINENTGTLTVTVKPRPFIASTNETPAYYALMISDKANSWLEGSGTEVNCDKDRALPGITGRTNWMWQLVQDGTNGYRIYNVGTEKYIGGRTATGGYLTLVDAASANSFIAVYNNATTVKFKDQTNNLWIDRSDGKTNAHTSGQEFTFKRMYKVTFSEAVAVNGGDAVSTIYVAADGSDSFTLPGYKLYSINGAAAVTNTEAVAAIAAAGTSDITVTVSDNPHPNVTYILKWSDGSTIKTEENVTTNPLSPSSDFLPNGFANDFVTLSYSPAEITSETSEVVVTATWNGPFKLSSDVASAKWYTVGIHTSFESENHIWKYYGDKLQTEPVAKDAYHSLSNVHCFAFFGNPYTGIKIYNKSAAKYVVKANDETQATFDATGTNFIPKASRESAKTVANGYSCFLVSDGTFYLNCHANDNFKVNGWHDNDAGSTCWFIPAGQYYLNYIDGLALEAPVGAVGTSSYFTTVANAAGAKNTLTSLRSTIEGALYSDMATLATVNNQLDPVRDAGKIALTDGYYRVISAVPGFNATAAWYYNPAVSTTNIVWAKAATTAEHQVNSIFKFTANDNKWNIYSPNAQQSITTGNGKFDVQNAALGEAAPLTVTSIGAAQYTLQQSNNYQTLHAGGHQNGSGSNGNLITYNSNGQGEASAWYIVKVDELPLTLNKVEPASYATLYVDFPVAIPEGNKSTAIYTLSESNGVYTCYKQTSVPPRTGIIIRDISAASSVTLSIPSTYNEDEEVTSALTGSFLDTTASSDCYIFSTGEEGLGFYLYASGSPLAANKAYLVPKNNDSGIRGFALSFNDTETGISETETFAKDSKLFDLQGRHIAKPQHGIYIVNGKKVLF